MREARACVRECVGACVRLATWCIFWETGHPFLKPCGKFKSESFVTRNSRKTAVDKDTLSYVLRHIHGHKYAADYYACLTEACQ